MAQADPLAKTLREELNELEREKSTFQQEYVDVEELVAPIRGTNIGSVLIKTPGSSRTTRIFDSIAVFANEQFAALMSSQLVNPQLKWLEFAHPDPKLNESEEVVNWMANARDAVLRLLNLPDSRFYTSVNEMFLDLGAFGTGMQIVEERDTGPPITFHSRPIQSVFIKESAREKIDTVFITFKWSARQAAQFYGKENLPDEIQRSVEQPTRHRLFSFLHVIRPREKFDATKVDPTNMPIESIHVDLKHLKVLKTSGFREMPAIVSRLSKFAGETYGRGPGINMLPDIRMVQRITESIIRGAQKTIEPPLQAPDDGVIGPVRTTPGAINFIRPPIERNKIIPLQTGSNPGLGIEYVATLQATILRGFFLDPGEFQEAEPRVTATAVLDRRDVRFRRMTPMIERLQSEWLTQAMDRVFAIALRKGLLPDLPPVLQTRTELTVRFSSPAAMAQLLTEAENMTRFLARILPVIELDPDARLNLNTDEYIRRMRRNSSAPAEILNPRKQVEQARVALNEARAKQIELQEAGDEAQVAKTTSEAEANGGTQT